MADVTVSELAKSVGASVDRLLGQMKEAGLKHGSAGDSVSDDEKQVLLNYLKNLHGGASTAREPKKITLKRKKVETLKAGSGSAGKRTVNVEVRKKRTYVKRSDEDIQAQAKVEQEAEVQVEAAVESDTTNEATNKAIDEAENKHKWDPKSILEIIEGANHVFGTSHPWDKKELSNHLKQVTTLCIDFLKK